MERHFFLKRMLLVAYEVFGSTGCSELAEIAILCILGMIASVLVITPGDQTFAGLYTLCGWLFACF